MLMTQRPGPYARPQKDPQAPATAKLAGLPLARTGISGGFDDLGLFEENDPARTSPGQRRAGGAIRGAGGRAQELPGTRSQALVDAVLSTRSVASLLHGVRHRAMEDMHSVHTDDECIVVGVYDGHGGVEAARHCRDTLPPLVLGELRGDGCSDTTMQRVLAEAFTRCDAELVESQRGEVEELEAAEESPPTGSCAGSTALLLTLHRGGRCLNIAWVGDCRAVLCRAGSHVQLTTDHRADCPREAARVVREGGEVVDGRLDGYLEVSRAFGDLDRATKAKPAGLSAKAEVCVPRGIGSSITSTPHTWHDPAATPNPSQPHRVRVTRAPRCGSRCARSA